MKTGISRVRPVWHVGEDPKANQINEDIKVARFPLATNKVVTDKERVKRHSLEMSCDNFVFIDVKRDGVREEER